MATDFKVLQPKEYYNTFLEQDVRPDGRELGEVRPTMLNVGSIGTADGSALIKLGNTTVMCGIKGELTSPKTQSPKHGFVVPNVELPPLCSPNFKPGPPSEQAQVASQFMDDVLQTSQCIALEDLCICEGKVVWVLYCDLLCLDYDGNLLDACVMALVAALKNMKLPKVTISEETGLPVTNDDNKVKLNLKSCPVATTFGIFEDKIIFADPASEEESLVSGVMTIVTAEDGKICAVHKPGGSRISFEQTQTCIDRALVRTKEVKSLLEDTLHSLDR